MFILLAFSSCSKEGQELLTDASTKSEIEVLLDKTLLPMEVKDNTLVFSSEENYQKVIDFLASIGDNNFDAFENYYGFSSFRQTSYFKEIEGKMDRLFATLLNEDAGIIIGPEKFSFDFASETVSVSVITDDDSSKGSKSVYDFEDDYFSIQDGNDVDTKADDYCNGRNLTHDFITTFIGAPLMRCSVRYYNFSIYHTLSAQLEHPELSTGTTEFDPFHEFGLYTVGECYVTNRNQYDGHVINLSSPMWSSNLNNGITYRPYQNSRRLTDYVLNVYFYLNDEPNDSAFSHTIQNWCVI